MNPERLTVTETRRALETKQFTSRELTEALLERSDQMADLNAFLWQDPEIVLEAAEQSDRRRQTGQVGPLEGVPIAIKDNLMTAGLPTTAASQILKDYIAPYDATVITKLKDAGAVIIGKTNLDEFAMGSSTENSSFGPTKNPWDNSRVPGGSSGGSAAAVAAGLAPCALGTDTGGSIRQPAAFTGLVGLKPTYGAVSRYGAIAMGSSLDQIGPLARNVADVRLLLDVLAGVDEHDASSVGLSQSPHQSKSLTDFSFGIPAEYFGPGMDPEIRDTIEQLVEQLKQQGVTVKAVSMPHTDLALSAYYIIMPAEVSSNLARFDGIRYGYSVEQQNGAHSLLDIYHQSRSLGFGPEVRRRILLGTYVLSAGYYDAYYKKASQVRRLVQADFDDAWRSVDLLLTPTSPIPAFKLGEKLADPLAMYLADVNTVPVNMAGLPAISLPCGLTKGGLPIGLQLIGPAYADHTILNAAEALEQLIQFQPLSTRKEPT